MKRSTQGFTLIELMVSTAILAFVLVALVALFTMGTRALEANEVSSERQQNAEAAAELLRYEVGLAGYRGTGSSSLTNNTFTGATLSIGVNGNADVSDTITVQYFEDRFYDGVTTSETLMQVTFSSGDDGSGEQVLLRQQGLGGALAAAADVDLLKVVKYVDRDGNVSDVTAGGTPPDELAAISIELTLDNGDVGRFLVGFENNPEIEQTTITGS